MAKGRDKILRILQVDKIDRLDGGNIELEKILKYTEPFQFLDANGDPINVNQVPDLQTVITLIMAATSGQSETVYKATFTQADITDGYVNYGLTGTQVTISEISKDSSGATLWTEAGGAQAGRNVAVDGAQYITIWYVGEAAVVLPDTYKLVNNSSINTTYTLSGNQNLTAGQTVQNPIIAGQAISANVLDGQQLVYTVYDSGGGVVVTLTQTGSGSINGVPMANGERQEFIYTNAGTESGFTFTFPITI